MPGWLTMARVVFAVDYAGGELAAAHSDANGDMDPHSHSDSHTYGHGYSDAIANE